MSKCTLCPRECGADRTRNRGLCGEGEEMRIAKTMLHRWEEPCISGSDPERGSGAVFFSGCPLHCVFCQNKDISTGSVGRLYTPKMLAEEMALLEKQGAYNINFVTPTHFTGKIREALDIYRPAVPLVFNTSGYEKTETLEALRGYCDIFLTDFKYWDPSVSEKYSKAPDYGEVALRAVKKMTSLVGVPSFSEDGMLKRGVIVRILLLPGRRRDAAHILEVLKNEVGEKNVLLSLMSQYTPDFLCGDFRELDRRVTSFEYKYVTDLAAEMGFEGYTQDRGSAKADYTPEFLK